MEKIISFIQLASISDLIGELQYLQGSSLYGVGWVCGKSGQLMSKDRAIEEVRADGLKIFIDDDTELNYIRRIAPKKVVIQAVAIRRAQQIAMNYVKRYAPELIKEFSINNSLRNQRSLKKYFVNYLPGKGENETGNG